MVHYREDLGNVENATMLSDGLVIIAILFKV